ncbi:MAG: hydrogen peroxide-inducible genes activator [Candidatus Binatia bacterium]
MTVNELRYAVAVAAELHFGRAAQKCFVSQPALSLAIQKLEDELGVKLFERRKHEVIVTDIGERIIAQAQRALEEVSAITDIARGGKDQLNGALRLGVIQTVGPYLLPELVAELRRCAPRMPLQIEENLTANLEQLLARGALDAVIVALPFAPPGIETRPLFTEAFRVLVPQRHRLGKKSRVSADDLLGEPVLLLRAGHCFREHVLEACPGISQADTGPLQGNSLETIRNMVASGLGISVFPASAVTARHAHALCRAVPFAPPAPLRQIALAWRKGFNRPAALGAVAEAIASLEIRGVTMLRAKR